MPEEVKVTKNGTKYLTEPNVYIVGHTQIAPWGTGWSFGGDDRTAPFHFLDSMGGETYLGEEAQSDGEYVCMFAGQLCYLSFGENRTKDPTKYFKRILESGHGSVLEHCSVTFLFSGIDRSVTHELVRHRAGWAYCLAGDTEIWSGARVNGRWDGVKKKWKIKELYEMTKTSHGRSRIPLIRLRSFDGEVIVPNKIKAIASSGIKDIHKITLDNGQNIRCSKDHRFLVEGVGYLPLHLIRVGDRVATNGAPVWTAEMRQKAREQKLGEKNPRWLGEEASENAGRLRCQKLYELTNRVCAVCGVTKNLHRHHKDGNTHNNCEDNIEILCAACHSREHHLGKRLTVVYRKVVSIEADGEEETYDIEMYGPHHNFVANGFVTHNSQVSQRYVDGDKLRFVEPLEYQINPSLHVGFESDIDRTALEYELTARELLAMQQNPHSTASKTDRRKQVNQVARCILPNYTEAPIMATANLRSIRHFLEQRSNPHADNKISRLAFKVGEIVTDMYPDIFQDFTQYEQKDSFGNTLKFWKNEYRKV